MPNENNPVENQALPPMPDAATTPIDMASAFKILNQANREAANAGMEQQQGSESAEGGPGDGAGEPQVQDDNGIDAGSVGSVGSGDGASDDGSPDGIEAIDFNAYKQDLLRNIQRNAANQVRREFEEQNIGYYSPAELTVRDEQTGQVRFRNPDVQDERDPNYYFKSRYELQQYCDAWNKGVDFEYRKAVNEKQRMLLQQEAPRAALIDFIPKFQAMDPATQAVFDALLEGHEVTDANGKTVGFKVNLDAVAAQAARIAKSFGGGVQNVQQQPAQQDSGGNPVPAASGPAMDIKAGNGQSEDEKEPTNIGEALKMFDKKNRGGK